MYYFWEVLIMYLHKKEKVAIMHLFLKRCDSVSVLCKDFLYLLIVTNQLLTFNFFKCKEAVIKFNTYFKFKAEF